MQCQFPNWALNRLQQQFLHKHNLNNNNTQEEEQTNHSNQDSSNRQQNKNTYMVIPYIKGLGDNFKRSCNKQGIQVYFKGTNIVKQLLMAPKDKDPRLTKSSVIYRYKCPRFGTRYYRTNEHCNLSNTIHHQCQPPLPKGGGITLF